MVLCNFFSLLLLALSLFHCPVSGQDLMHMCLSSGNYATNDPYETNLDELLWYLIHETPTNGFTMSSKGEGQNQTHGLALCRGDLSPTDCRNCVVNASDDILTFCPNKKGAIIIYENCTVRYSNKDFFGKTVSNIMLCLKSPKNVNVSNHNIAMLSRQSIQEFLSQVSEEAVLDPKMYASRKAEIDEFNTVYGLAQCSRDLSPLNCKNCLDQSVAYLAVPECGNERKGVSVYNEICRVRYELNPFLNDEPLRLASSNCLDAAGILLVMGLLSHLLSHYF